ncbi:MAG: TylF/MycF/NovP-related O-methyltransferase [Desulfobacterales bacterium]|nr:TylF/MycF/NovP-related O-methyltransferase [Desulfobacterales bacterium]
MHRTSPGKAPTPSMAPETRRKINRWHIRNKSEAVEFLAKKARNAFKDAGKRAILLVGPDDPFSEAIRADLAARGMAPRRMALSALESSGVDTPDVYACVICTYTDIRRTGAVARLILQDPVLGRLTFEYVTFPRDSYATLERHTETTAADLVSPLPGYPVDVFALYEEALKHFEKKCDIRDFMDLCQLLKNTLDNGIDGDFAEFGSFRGHSGYLMASLLAKFGVSKTLYLFDTFSAFPQESFGIDQFWSQSHPVDFAAVQAKFEAFPFVRFVQGDFTRTFDDSGIQRLALAYVDCDAYRSTAYLIRRIYPEVLSPGGIMVFEDYGHAQLLGNRVAVDDYFSNRSGCVSFFSQFSGSFIVIKIQ